MNTERKKLNTESQIYYFKYFSILEERFERILQYIELDQNNFSVFSIELSSLINECCSLMVGAIRDVYQLYYRLNKKELEKFNITKCKTFIKSFNMCKYEPDAKHRSQLINEIVLCNNIYMQPWKSIESGNKTIAWWKNYTDIKHGGIDGYKCANLLTAVFAMSAMFIVLYMIDDNEVYNWRGLFSVCGNYVDNKNIIDESLLMEFRK